MISQTIRSSLRRNFIQTPKLSNVARNSNLIMKASFSSQPRLLSDHHEETFEEFTARSFFYIVNQMGVYIPPPNDNDDDSNKDPKPKSTSISGSDSDSTTIIIPNPSSLIPRNPSIGLIWGPLTPASDNLPALYSMIGIQFFIGYGFFKMARNNLRSNFINGKIYRKSITKGLVGIILGSGCIFGSGLELTRLSLPYDPWYDEAKYYRKISLKNGIQPSNWFGGYKFFKPMDFNTWLNKLNIWIKNVETSEVTNLNQSQILLKMNLKGKYNEIYKKLNETNNKRFDDLLNNDLSNVNEHNKGIRLDEIIEGKSLLINHDYTKPNIQLGNHTMENDDEFEMVWVNFDPWDELKLETDYDIRLIPRCTIEE